MADISHIQKVQTGDKLHAGYFNEIAEALLDSGFVSLPEVTSVPVDATSKASAEVGYVAYAKTIDGVATVFFADELPDDSEAFLGVVTEVNNGTVTFVAPEDATVDPAHKEVYAYITWGDFDGTAYATSVGSYDTDGNKLSDATEDVEGAAFTIKASGSNTNVKKAESDSDFQTDFGTATALQRTLAMTKLKGFDAAKLCRKYNPKASVINMKGLWYLPVISELDALYQNRTTIYPKLTKYGTGVQTNNYYWSGLEFDATSAWYESLYKGITPGDIKNYNHSCRAFCRV